MIRSCVRPLLCASVFFGGACAWALAQNQPTGPAGPPATGRKELPPVTNGPAEMGQPPRGRAGLNPPPTLGEARIEVIHVQHVSAHELADMLQQLMSRFISHASVNTIGTDTLVLAAEPASFDVLRKLINDVDQPALGQARTTNKIIWLKQASAKEVGKALATVFSGPQTRIFAYEDSNGLLLSSAAPQEIERMQAVVEEIDAKISRTSAVPIRDRQLRFYPVKNVDSNEIAAVANSLLAIMRADTKLIADANTNSLVAFASDEEAGHLETIIRTLDVAPVQRPGTPEKKQ